MPHWALSDFTIKLYFVAAYFFGFVQLIQVCLGFVAGFSSAILVLKLCPLNIIRWNYLICTRELVITRFF